MTNNLRKISQDLRTFAKRTKGFKYTDSSLITFLMTGLVFITGNDLAATEDSGIKNQVSEINTSIAQIRTNFKRARKENNKLIKDTNLELTQLMEQGDHVTKSPWSSWQYGINYFYNDWHGTFKGKGNKVDNVIYKRDQTLNRYIAKPVTQNTLNATTLGFTYEPNAAIPVSASITPRDINKQAPQFLVSGPSGGLPNFEPRTVKAPGEPVVTPLTFEEPEQLVFPASGANPSQGKYSTWGLTGSNNDGNISQVSVTGGSVLKKYNSINSSGVYNATVTSDISIKDLTTSATSPTVMSAASAGSTNLGSAVPTGEHTYNNDTQQFFMTLLDSPYTYFDTGTHVAVLSPDNISGTHRGTVINMETEGTPMVKFANNPSLSGVLSDLTGYTTETGLTNDTNGQLYHVNKGTVEIGGNGARYIHTTYNGGTNRVNILENRGKIISMNYNAPGYTTNKNVIYFHSPDATATNAQHIYANHADGTIEIYGKEGILMLYTSSNTTNNFLAGGDVMFVNKGTVNLYGQKSTALAINTDSYGSLTAPSGFILKKAINIYGDKSVGLYVLNSGDGIRNDKNELRFIIGDKSQGNLQPYVASNPFLGGSYAADSSTSDTGYSNKYTEGVIGIYQNATKNAAGTNDTTLKTALPELTMEAFTRKSAGIYTKSGDVKIDHGTVTANKGKISILGGEENVGLYAFGGGISFKGNIEMGGSASTLTDAITTGYKNTAVYATDSHKVTVEGKITTDKNSKELTESTVIYGKNSAKINLVGENDIRLKAAAKTVTGSTGNNTGVFVDDAKVNFGDNENITPTTTGSSTAGSSITITGDDRNLGTALYAKAGGKINANANSLAKGLKITVKDGASAVASVGKKTSSNVSEVNIKYSTVDYDGEGFALYTDTDGKIDAQNSKIKLGGKAVGFRINGSGGTYTSNVTLTNAAFEIVSDDVILMNVLNPNSLNLSTFVSTLSGASGLNASNITTNGAGAGDNYKLAVVEGLNNGKSFTFDNTLDKSLAVSSSNASTNDYKYVRNFLIQRSILDVNSNISSILSTSDATTISGDPMNSAVIGLDISSSKGATSNIETQINLNSGATVTVDRTDAGNGAIGLFVNYGKINIKNGATLDVETNTGNTINSQAVGAFGVNGSEINNNLGGTIKVGGEESIGMLGLALRENKTTGNPIINEFGSSAAGQGTITINNDGNIILDGKNAKGIYIKNNNTSATSSSAVATNKSNGVITLTGNGTAGNASVAMYGVKSTLKNEGKIDLQGTNSQIGIYGVNNSTVSNEITGKISVGTSNVFSSADVPNIGIYSDDINTITSAGEIEVKENSYGIYGKNITLTNKGITVDKNGVGIFATGDSTLLSTPVVTIQNGATIKINDSIDKKEAVAVFTAESAPVDIVNNGKIELGDNTFGFVLKAPGILNSNTITETELKNSSIYAYSSNSGTVINNNTPLKAVGNNNYGIYSNGTVNNHANMNLKSGIGNVGIYSTGGIAKNNAIIEVGKTNLANKDYSIGMATGYYNETTGAITNEGTIENHGTIYVSNDNSIGMYAVGAGSKAINHGTIDISGKNATGMYIDQGAEGVNYGTIKSTGTASGIKGVATVNGGYIKNYGTISITSPGGIGIYQDAMSAIANKNEPTASGVNPLTLANQTGTVNGTKAAVYSATSTDQKYIVTPKGSLLIQNPPKAPRLTINGKEVALTGVDTNIANPTPAYVTAGSTTLDLSLPLYANTVSNAQVTEVGMYVDTSGVNYTNPIQGLNNLVGLENINLIIGTEAAKYTDAKAIEIGENILKPYNDAISSLTTTGTTLNINSAGLTWLAQPLKGTSKPIETLYMIKIPYTFFASAKDENTYNFLDGLEQRYGVEPLGSRERLIFDKLNGLGKGETHIFTQAVDEMKGHQYANTQQRINATGNTLDKEFRYLRDEWRNPSKQNNKIKAFGTRDEYSTDTAGIIDYRSNAYGVAYVHEDEKVRMGNSIGWYAGAVTNRFKFKDIGHSTEDQTMVKLGVFKTLSPKGDYNGALQWTISGDVFAGVNNMKRRFWVVDDTFEAKSTYHSYGAAIKNELGYNIRMSERTHLRPYGALKMEYGKFNEIKEKTGQMRLEVKGNDYFSVKPEVGMEFKYVQPLAVKTNLTVGLTAAYENEIGKLQEGNQARVGYTTAGWYNLEKEKEDRRGNGKFDLNIGVDNTRFGVTVNAGYDTKGNNVRGGIGFRAIY